MNKKVLLLIGLSILFLQFITISQVYSLSSLTEAETKDFLNNNPDTVIIDIRWPDIYNEYHLRGAILVDNGIYSGHEASAKQALVIANQETGGNTTIPILVICNCPDTLEPENGGTGSYASEAAAYLEDNGYTNVHHFFGSFSDWKDATWLVGGTSPAGDTTLTALPQRPGPDYTILIILVGGGVVFGGGFLVMSMRGSSTDQASINKSQQKQKEKIDQLKEVLQTDDSDSSKNRKKSVRRR